jgi:hypothetical protein
MYIFIKKVNLLARLSLKVIFAKWREKVQVTRPPPPPPPTTSTLTGRAALL